MTDNDIILLQCDLARCQGLVEGIYSGLQFNQFNKLGLLRSLNEVAELLQKSRDKIKIEQDEPKY